MKTQKVKECLSRQIQAIETNGFGYLGPVLRVALFGDSDTINWEKVREEFEKQNPEEVE